MTDREGTIPILYDAQNRVIRSTPEQRAAFEGRPPGPGVPLTPVEPRGEEPRAYFPPIGQNLNYVPRTEFPWLTPFDQLRNLAAASWIVATAVEDVKQQVLGMQWDVHSIEDKSAKRLKDNIARVKNFFRRPDRIHDFRAWLAQLLDDTLVCDALTIYRQRTVNGEPYALKPINGATIKPIVDSFGTPPEPPETAYQQIGYGRVETEYHRPYTDRAQLDLALRQSRSQPAARPVELVYAPRSTRTYTPYGQGPVERVVIILNVALRRDLYYLGYYTEGNIPEAFWKCPESWTPSQIQDMQTKFELMLAGEIGQRRRLRFMAGGPNSGLENPRGHDQWQKDFDEYLARAVCYAFSTSPLPLVQLMNRATGEMADAEESHSGFHPIRQFIADLLTREIHEFLGEPELEFIWTEDKEANEQLEYERSVAYVDRGIDSVDEVRARRGDPPTGIPRFIMTPAGPIFVDDLLAEHAAHGKPADVAPGTEGQNALDLPLPPAAGGGSATGEKPASKPGEAARALDVPLPPAAGKLVRNLRVAVPGRGSITIPKARVLEAPLALELKRWKKVALKCLGGPQRAFVSKEIPGPLKKAIGEWLDTARSEEEVGWAFRSLVRARRPLVTVRRRLRLERAVRKAARDHFLDHAAAVAKVVTDYYIEPTAVKNRRLAMKTDPPDNELDKAMNWEVFMEEIQGPVGQAFLEGETVAGEAHGITVEFGITDEQAAAYAKERAATLVGKRVLSDGTVVDAPSKFAVSQTVRDDLRATIARAFKEGWSEKDLQNAIENKDFWNWRADRIARTEVAVALNKGTAVTYRTAGVETVSILDGHGCLRDGHDDKVAGVNGETWTLEEYEEDPVGHPNCTRDAVPNLESAAA